MTDKPSTSFRLSVEAKTKLEDMATRRGISRTAVLEMIIRAAYRGEINIKKQKKEKR